MKSGRVNSPCFTTGPILSTSVAHESLLTSVPHICMYSLPEGTQLNGYLHSSCPFLTTKAIIQTDHSEK